MALHEWTWGKEVVTESSYNLHYVKVKIRLNCDTVMEIRTVHGTWHWGGNESQAVVGVVVSVVQDVNERTFRGFQIFLSWSGPWLHFNYWNSHWRVHILYSRLHAQDLLQLKFKEKWRILNDKICTVREVLHISLQWRDWQCNMNKEVYTM